jgi:hypothetical protein
MLGTGKITSPSLKNNLLIIALCLVFSVCAQEKSDSSLTSRYRPGAMWFFTGWRPAQPEKVRKYDRLIFDITYNTWHGEQSAFSNSWRSIGFNSSLYFDIPLTKYNTVSLGTGISHSLFRIQHNGFFTVDPSHSYTDLTFVNGGSLFKRVLLGGNSLSVPFELRFRGREWKHFKMHFGAKVGYELNLYSKTYSEGIDGMEIVKNYDFPDIHRLLYSAHIRLGSRNWALYVSYAFNPVFSNRESTRLNLIQMGLSLSLF